jgi:hypothetical protein
VVAYEDDLLGSTVEVDLADRGASAPVLRTLTIHLSGQRKLYIEAADFHRAASDYGGWVYRATITAAHLARATVMEP